MSKKLQVRIVLAADAAAFSQERVELKEFVESLNEEKGSVSYELLTQEALEKEEEAGQSFYLLIGQEFGAEESGIFHKVYDRFRQTGAPAIYTYFHRKDSDPLTDSVKAFMTELDEEIGHFFSLYEDLDSVKLGILMELARDPGMEKAFAIRGGAACLNGKKVLSLENLPFYQGNESLQALLKEQKDLADRFEKAAVALAHDPDNRELLAEKSEISRRQKEVFDDLEKQEENLCELLLEIARMTGSARTLTSSEKLAIRELEKGAYDNAQQILRKADRSLAGGPARSMLAAEKKVLAGYVSENRLLIKTLMASGVTAERAEEIRSCWEEILRLTKEFGLDPVQAVEYTEYLQQTRDIQRSLEVIELLDKLYMVCDVPEEEHAALLIEKGISLAGQGQGLEAEKCMISGVKKLRELVRKPGEERRLMPDLLLACYNLGVFEKDHFGKMEQAAYYLKEAEEGYLKLCEENPAYWETRVSLVYTSQGDIYQRQNKNKKALERYEKALKICERTAENDLMGMGQQLAENLLRIAAIKTRQDKKREAYELRIRAADIYEQMYRRSPRLYQLDWGRAAAEAIKMEYAEKKEREDHFQKGLIQALRLNSKAGKLDARNPKKREYLEKAAALCKELEKTGMLHSGMGDIYGNYGLLVSGEERNKLFEKAWNIYIKCFPKDRSHCIKNLNKLLQHFWEKGSAEEKLSKAEEILGLIEILEETDKQIKQRDLEDIYGTCGDIYQDCGKIRKAEEKYLLARDAIVQQLEESPGELGCRQRLQKMERLLRGLYLKDFKSGVKDYYKVEELGSLLKLGSAGRISASIRGRNLSDEEKTVLCAESLLKAGEKFSKKEAEQKKAEFDYQAARVLYRQLEDHFPGKYKEKIKDVDIKISDLHSHWKEE